MLMATSASTYRLYGFVKTDTGGTANRQATTVPINDGMCITGSS